MTAAAQRCAYCEVPIIGAPAYTIHRDGMGIGPELPLCRACGSEPEPTCEQVWARLRERYGLDEQLFTKPPMGPRLATVDGEHVQLRELRRLAADMQAGEPRIVALYVRDESALEPIFEGVRRRQSASWGLPVRVVPYIEHGTVVVELSDGRFVTVRTRGET